MSATTSSPESIEARPRPSLQPYQCQICHSRFTRQENLKRHSALHTRSPTETPLPCGLCDATFSRPDLRHRHIKRKHRDQQNQSCQRRRSPPLSLPDEDADMSNDTVDIWRSGIPDSDSPASNTVLPKEDEWFPSDSQVAHGCLLFFDHVSPFLPFLHQPTFAPSTTPDFLLLSILSLAYQYGDDPDCAARTDTGVHLARRCFEHARRSLATQHNYDDDDIGDDHLGNLNNKRGDHDDLHTLALVQSHLMLQICAIMYMCGKTSSFGLKIHSRMILLARAEGLLRPLSTPNPGTTQDLDALWRQFAASESHKRTLFAVHQIDALWYQFLSIPRQLSHLEIKHSLPCPQDLWSAASSTEWAHRQLVSNNSQSGPAVQYTEAVRRFLSSDPHLDTLPPFDPYGAINLTQFLISSAQEISGWCTMTGVLSTERLEPLRSALLALSPYVWPDENQAGVHNHSSPVTSNSSPATRSRRNTLCEATWASAMIDIQIWSPSHTSGIVGTSMDAVLNQLTCLAPSCEFLCESNIAQTIQPHVDWFLHYLDATMVLPGQEQQCHPYQRHITTNSVAAEAPWVTLYAYKAFMIAWQLVRGGVPGAMIVVGVEDGDVQGALDWAKAVFGRRRWWQLGRLVMACLDTLVK